MKRILATTALVALTAAPVFAQTATEAPADQTDPLVQDQQTDPLAQDQTDPLAQDQTDPLAQTDPMGSTVDFNGMQISADDMIGRTVYVSNVDGAGTAGDVPATDGAAVDGTATTQGTDTAGMDAPANDWDNVGSINDVIFGADGGIEAVVLDIGGFLGMGTRQIATTMDELTLINDTSSDGEFFIVFNGSPAELEERPELDRDTMNQQGSTFHSGSNDAMMGTDTAQTPTAPTDLQDTSPATGTPDATAIGTQDPTMPATDPTSGTGGQMDGNFLGDADRTALTADDLMGTDVHDMSDERVGSITDIVLTADGQVSDVIIDVGGFLGLGARSVAIAFDDLQFAREEGAMTTSLRAVTQLTADQIENMPEWNNPN
jgi:hypothetical protein